MVRLYTFDSNIRGYFTAIVPSANVLAASDRSLKSQNKYFPLQKPDEKDIPLKVSINSSDLNNDLESHPRKIIRQVGTPENYYAGQLITTSTIGKLNEGFVPTEAQSGVEINPAGLLGPEDGSDAWIMNSSHCDGIACARACIVVSLSVPMQSLSGIVEALVYTPQIGIYNMGIQISIADHSMGCLGSEWSIVLPNNETTAESDENPATPPVSHRWVGGPYSGLVRAIKLEIWSAGGNGFNQESEYFIDAVRIFGSEIPMEDVLGKSILSNNSPKNGSGDPRVCGVKLKLITALGMTLGSSPRVRGRGQRIRL